jgi:putative ABC transport system permease protein
MLHKHFLLAFRNLAKNRLFSSLNILGLAVGLAAAAYLGLYVIGEWQTDRFLPAPERTFRVLRVSGLKDIPYEIGITAPNFAPALENDFAGQIEKTVQFMRGEAVLRLSANQVFQEKKMAWGDAGFIPFFDLKMYAGDPKTALEKPGGLVLTRKTARRYFGSESNAMGQILKIDNEIDAQVTGILEDFPANTHFDFDLLLSMKTAETTRQYWTDWWNSCLITYARLKPGVGAQQVESRFEWFMNKYFAEDFANFGSPIGLRLQPLRDMYFDKEVRYDLIPHGNRSALRLFAFAALVLLLVAGANYVNLSTARASERSREIGVQKALGAGVGRIRGQFLVESMVLTAAGVGLAALVVWVALPSFESLFGTPFRLRIPLWVGLAGLPLAILLFGFLAGFYPAALLASFRPVKALRGQADVGNAQALVRRALVVFQFSLSVVLICGTILIQKQLAFLAKKDLGYQRENILLVSADNPEVYQKRKTLEQLLKNTPGVAVFSRTGGAPGGFHDALNFKLEGRDEIAKMRVTYVDNDFTETFGIQVLAGRDFSPDFAADTTEAALVNRSAALQMGYQPEAIVGKVIRETMFDSIPKRIVGVVADYHFSSLRDRVEPLVIMQANWSGNYALRLDQGTQSIEKSIAAVERIWHELAPAFPFHYQFLDESLNRLYMSETRQGRVFSLFAGLAIFIACVGMFGLATFAATKRTKEIGIRKVLGASVAGITALLARDFLKLVLLAFVFATPLAWYLMRQWLADFAYRVEIAWWMFALAGLLAVAIAFVTIGVQSVRAALANPVKSLRSE